MRGPVYLVGMMGSGKTTVGRLLATALGEGFVDLDAYIEQREQRSVAALFAQGEASFRAAERAATIALAERAAKEELGGVIALGGGAYLDAEIRAIADASCVVYLHVDSSTLLRRLDAVQRARRPFFGDANTAFDAEREAQFAQLQATRHSVYACAAHRVDASASPDAVVAEIKILLATIESDGGLGHQHLAGQGNPSRMQPEPATPATVADGAQKEVQGGQMGATGTNPEPSVAVTVAVPGKDLGYEVLCGAGLFGRLGSIVRTHARQAKRVAVITDDHVGPLYLDGALSSFEAEGFETHSFVVPAGEAAKNPSQLQALIEGMLAAGLSRADLVVTLGGGVVGDLGGLAAASFMRGIDFVQVPTSLLAQVDASVGGKVAIDLPAGKNLWGAFHFPRVVVIDPALLQTLPERHLRAGMAEMIKHGALFSAAHFHEVVAGAADILAHRMAASARLVAASVAYKAACVARDPREAVASATGRVVLNLGHTVGHALESLSEYELLHGEAVALGLIAAARISIARSGAQAELEVQMLSAARAAGLPTELDMWLDRVGVGALITFMQRDKKRGATAKLTFVTLSELGKPCLEQLSAQEIAALLQPPSPAT